VATDQRRLEAQSRSNTGAAEMSEHTEASSPDHADNAIAPPPQAPEPPQRGALPWLCGLGFLILAGGIYAAWEYPRKTVSPDLQALQQRLADFDARITVLEQRPAPVAPVPPVSSVSSVSQADLDKLAARIDAAEAKIPDQNQINSRIDAVSGKIEALSGRIQTGMEAVKQQTDRITARVAALEKASGSLDSVSDHLSRLARIQEANLALAAGRPVGDLPDAPPALARFAHAAPPTETQLRQLFLQSERAAIAAKQPDNATIPLVDRIWERAQNLVTVHRGDDVVVGNPSSVTLGHARAALDAGDLKGAISTVELLKGQPRDAMSNWLEEAKSLVDARAALAGMAGQS
jgi:hypothetical protein